MQIACEPLGYAKPFFCLQAKLNSFKPEGGHGACSDPVELWSVCQGPVFHLSLSVLQVYLYIICHANLKQINIINFAKVS